MSTRSVSRSTQSSKSSTLENEPKVEECTERLLQLLEPGQKSGIEQPSADPTTRNSTKQAIEALLKAQAWPLQKRPLTRFVIQPSHLATTKPRQKQSKKIKVVLPRSYRGAGGDDSRNISVGDDLNYLVYKWYGERKEAEPAVAVTTKSRKKVQAVAQPVVQAINYVNQQEIMPSRHEYMGPDPHVAGYHFSRSGDEVRIRFWDPFLKDAWMGREHWEVEVQDVDGVWQEAKS